MGILYTWSEYFSRAIYFANGHLKCGSQMLISWSSICTMTKQKWNTCSSSNFQGNKFCDVTENCEVREIYGPRKISTLRYLGWPPQILISIFIYGTYIEEPGAGNWPFEGESGTAVKAKCQEGATPPNQTKWTSASTVRHDGHKVRNFQAHNK